MITVAIIRTIIKRTLRRYGYPPDKQKTAIELVLKQAKMMREDIIIK